MAPPPKEKDYYYSPFSFSLLYFSYILLYPVTLFVIIFKLYGDWKNALAFTPVCIFNFYLAYRLSTRPDESASKTQNKQFSIEDGKKNAGFGYLVLIICGLVPRFLAHYFPDETIVLLFVGSISACAIHSRLLSNFTDNYVFLKKCTSTSRTKWIKAAQYVMLFAQFAYCHTYEDTSQMFKVMFLQYYFALTFSSAPIEYDLYLNGDFKLKPANDKTDLEDLWESLDSTNREKTIEETFSLCWAEKSKCSLTLCYLILILWIYLLFDVSNYEHRLHFFSTLYSVYFLNIALTLTANFFENPVTDKLEERKKYAKIGYIGFVICGIVGQIVMGYYGVTTLHIISISAFFQMFSILIYEIYIFDFTMSYQFVYRSYFKIVVAYSILFAIQAIYGLCYLEGKPILWFILAQLFNTCLHCPGAIDAYLFFKGNYQERVDFPRNLRRRLENNGPPRLNCQPENPIPRKNEVKQAKPAKNAIVVPPTSSSATKYNCKICLLPYSGQTPSRTPRMLRNCGHTVCQECAMNLTRKKAISCPFCRTSCSVNGSVERLPKNFAVLEIIQENFN